MTPLSICAKSAVVSLLGALVLVGAAPGLAQTNYYANNGGEYLIAGALGGDQMFPDVAVSLTNGFVVWQDNATDGDGWGISARRLDSTLSGTLATFRVNAIGAGNQERPRVAMLRNGGAAIVWQGGVTGFQHVYGRFLTATNTFLTTNDLLISTFTNNFQITPALTVLTNGNVVVVWASYGQVKSNSMQDVYCQILTTNGTKVGTNFLVNQFTTYNQRTPTVAALKNGGFVVAWVSEQQNVSAGPLGTNTTFATAASTPMPSANIYARMYNSNGVPTTSEFRVDSTANPCANPAVAAAADGSFMVTWDQHDQVNLANGWDIYARSFSSVGTIGSLLVVNTHLIGDQYAPRICGIASDYLVTWISLGQDGSREGVYGQFVHSTGVPVGGEFRVNTTTSGSQTQPTVASDGVSQFVAVWSGFDGAVYGFDLFGQRYLNVGALLPAMSAPYVWAPYVMSNNLYQPRLVVTWAPLLGLPVADYEVYVNGAGAPLGVVTNTTWTMTAASGLTLDSTNSFAVDYVTTDGRRSPLSPSSSGVTWDLSNDNGIPAEWMEAYFGYNNGVWPNVNAPLVAGGPSLYQIFVSGGDPTDPSTWLHQAMTRTAEGIFLSWNTQPGATYQVQSTTNFVTWSNVGAPRFAAGATDSINVGGSAATYYRIVLMR